MTHDTANPHPLAGRWVDLLAALLIAISSLMFVLAGGHGIGVLGMLVIGVPLSESIDILFTPWGLHFWIGIGLLLSMLLPIRIRLAARWLAVVASLGVVGWFYSFSEWRSAFFVSAIPNILTCLLLATVTFILHGHRLSQTRFSNS